MILCLASQCGHPQGSTEAASGFGPWERSCWRKLSALAWGACRSCPALSCNLSILLQLLKKATLSCACYLSGNLNKRDVFKVVVSVLQEETCGVMHQLAWRQQHLLEKSALLTASLAKDRLLHTSRFSLVWPRYGTR